MATLKNRKKIRILCLPGEEVWDLDFFSQYKEVSEIVGLEIVPTIVEEIQWHEDKRVKIVRQHSSDYLLQEANPFDLIYLDYMTNLNSVITFDAQVILRRKLVKPGGFLVMAIYGNRGGPGTTCVGKVSYSDFCEALKKDVELDVEFQRMLRLAWNSILGLHHLVSVSPRGHYVKTSVPVWKSYKIEAGKMFTVEAQIQGYPHSKQEEALRKRLSQWLLTGRRRVCEEIEEDRNSP
jgi:hypothetical protein